MFLYIPLGIFLIAVIGLVFLIYKKIPFLKKIEPDILEQSQNNEGFFEELLPEIFGHFNKSNLEKHKLVVVSLSERFVRRLRIIWMRVDSYTHSIINFLRRRNKEISENISKNEEIEEKKSTEADIIEISDGAEIDKDKLRIREQELILSVAKNPKDASLYEELGDIYSLVGDIEYAIESYAKVIELIPDNEGVKLKLDKIKKHINI